MFKNLYLNLFILSITITYAQKDTLKIIMEYNTVLIPAGESIIIG